MSVRTGFAIIGTAVGAYFGNASLGYAIGSMVGGYVDPIKNKGPRLTDAQQQTAQDGVPIPITFGSVRISGNIIASSELTEHKNKDDGKGSGTETTTYTYTRTYAIGICEGPIAAIRRVWKDGQLVYDTTPGGDFQKHSTAAHFRSNVTFYLGDETQEPDSALQAVFGTDAVPAFRGLAYISVRDDDVTARGGSISSFEFEVVQIASSTPGGDYIAPQYGDLLWQFLANTKTDPRLGTHYEYGFSETGSVAGTTWYPGFQAAALAISNHTGQAPASSPLGWVYELRFNGGSGDGASTPVAPYEDLTDPTETIVLGLLCPTNDFGSILDTVDMNHLSPEQVGGGIWSPDIRLNGVVRAVGTGVILNAPSKSATRVVFNDAAQPFYFAPDAIIAVRALKNCTLGADPSWLPIPGSPGFYVAPDGGVHQVGDCAPVSGEFNQLQAEQLDVTGKALLKRPYSPAAVRGGPEDNEAFWTAAYEQAVFDGRMPSGYTYGAEYPQTTDIACFCTFNEVTLPEDPLLSFIVASLCERVGVSGTNIDVSQLTDTVKGFTVATATSAADAINALAPAYQFDEAEWDDRIRFIKRGGATLAALNEDDAFDSDDGRIVETRAQELELPRKMALSYMDVGANYAVTTQTAERLSSTVASSGVDQIALSLVMDADKAAQTVDILLKDQWSSINGTLVLSVGDEFSVLVPTDPLFLSYGEALFRSRVVEVENADGIVKLSLQQDNSGTYQSTAVGVPPRPAQEGNPVIAGPTFAEVMNLPALRDQDDRVGLYLAACGPVGRWTGAQVAISTDGGLTWRDVLQMTQSSTMGALNAPLPTWTPHVPDPFHELEVVLTDGDFESTTRAQMYAGANPLCVGDEILQFQTETLTSPGEYTLGTVLFRGRKNTDPQTWPQGSRVVDLEDAYFLPLDRSYIGKTLTFRFTTFGTDVQYGTIKTADFTTAKSVREWPVTNVLHSRETDGSLNLSWSPRHRLGTSRTPYASQYFNGYLLVFTNGSITKQFATPAQGFAYSASDQTADFGSAGPLTVIIYATNSIVGPGEGYTRTV